MVDAAEWRRDTLINRVQSLLLIGFMCGFLALLGYLVGGSEGLMMLLAFSLLLLSLNSVGTPWLMLRLYRARRIRPEAAPGLYAILLELARRAELPDVPTLFYVPSRLVNAFSLGHRRNAAIALTDGLLTSLDARELAGVLAHELSHIRNGDLKVMGLADLMTRLTGLLSLVGQLTLLINLPLLWWSESRVDWWLVGLLVFAPQIALLSQLGLSRVREYHADLNAALLTGDPEGLARALAKIERGTSRLMRLLLPGWGVPEPSWLRTHPPTPERVRRLFALERPPTAVWPTMPRDPGPLFGTQRRRLPRYHWSGLWY